MVNFKKLKKKPKFAHKTEPQEALSQAFAEFNKNNFTGALKILSTIIQKNPRYGHAFALKGLCLQEQNDIDAAILALRKATELLPGDQAAQYNLGVLLQNQDQLEEAATYYKKAIKLKPDHHMALNNLGTIQHLQGDIQEATKSFETVIKIDPEAGGAYLNLGEIYRKKGDFNLAIKYFDKGLELSPNSPSNYNNLGSIYKDFGKLSKAEECFKKAIELDNSLHISYNNVGVALIGQGKLEEAIEWFEKALAIKEDFNEPAQNILMASNYPENLTPEEIFERHRQWGKKIEARLANKRITHDTPIERNRKIRVGYVSADFWQHAVGNFIEPALAVHNHDDFEIICYSDVEYPDTSTEGLRKFADKWHETKDLKDDELIDLITADGIDILVDLSGHMGRSRLSAFARKPAPIQVTYLGYPNTTGLTTMDYRISDNIADPVGKTEHLHTESIARMPNCFLCYAPPPEDLPINQPPMLEKGHVTFASFNNRPKITDTVIACWAKILKKVPNSRLVLKSSPLRDKKVREELLQKFSAQGIDHDRIELQLYVPTYAAHMQLYNQADIALDTFPYNGTTTTFEALWMGVPVITIAGESHVSRVSASILSQIGRQDLITKSTEEYIDLTIKLANDPERLTELRRDMRQRLHNSPACDRWGFTRDLENAYRKMVTEWNHTVSATTENKDHKQNAALLVAQGEELFGTGNMTEAAKLFQRAIDLDPANEDAHNNLGVIYWQNNNPMEAIRCFQEAIKLNPGNINAIDNLSEALQSIDESQKQNQPQTTVDEDNLNKADEINLEGEQLFAQNKIEEAALAFTEALKIDPEHLSAQNNLGVINWQRANKAEAIECFRKVLAMDPTFLPAIDNLQQILQTEAGNPVAHNTKPTLRILHNLARSGGTLLSKCLGCMQDVVLLSEIHPQGVQWFNPLQQAQQWFNLFSEEEIKAIEQQGGVSFADAIDLIHQKCLHQGKHLIIRDWSHLDFMAAPFLACPTNKITINEVLGDKFNIREFNTTRHPIDQWLSLSRLSIMQEKLTLEAFLAGYRKFAELCIGIGFIRYEDFIDNPTAKMKELCDHLDTPFDPSFIDKWWDYKTISGDVKSVRGDKKEIKRVPRYPVSAELLNKFANNSDYQAIIAILGYNHPE